VFDEFHKEKCSLQADASLRREVQLQLSCSEVSPILKMSQPGSREMCFMVSFVHLVKLVKNQRTQLSNVISHKVDKGHEVADDIISTNHECHLKTALRPSPAMIRTTEHIQHQEINLLKFTLASHVCQ
jgi:hypothetical protein